MDMKGISWVGNIYQKFEAMCLEVEEIMYQDTVKYVENQVSTVGSSVKRFYSDVMEDLHPLSSADAAKGAVSDVPMELYADVGMYAKPKVRVKEKTRNFDSKERSDEDPKAATVKVSDNLPTPCRPNLADIIFPLSEGDSIAGASRQDGERSISGKSNSVTRKNPDADNSSLDKKSVDTSFSGKELTKASLFFEPTDKNLGGSVGAVPKEYADKCLFEDSDLATHVSSERNNMRTYENSERNRMSLYEKSGVAIPCHKDSSRATSVCEPANEKHKYCTDQKPKITTLVSVEVTRHASVDEGNNMTKNAPEQIPDLLLDGALSDMDELMKPGMSKETDTTPSSHGSSSAEAHVADCKVAFHVESCANAKVQSSEIAEVDFVLNPARSDDRSTYADRVDFSVDCEMEIVQVADKTKLEESCILVNGDECYFIPRNGRKSQSYKKKIRGVFSSRKRSTRKHEYEELSIWPGIDSDPHQEESAKISTLRLAPGDAQGSSATDSFESEWELL